MRGRRPRGAPPAQLSDEASEEAPSSMKSAMLSAWLPLLPPLAAPSLQLSSLSLMRMAAGCMSPNDSRQSAPRPAN